MTADIPAKPSQTEAQHEVGEGLFRYYLRPCSNNERVGKRVQLLIHAGPLPSELAPICISAGCRTTSWRQQRSRQRRLLTRSRHLTSH
jgi:hypothetical protein